MGLNPSAQEAPVVFAGLHHHREIRQLSRAVVDVQAVEVVLHDAAHRITVGIAHCAVDLHEHVKGVHQNVTAAHARIQQLDILQLHGGITLTDLS